MKITDYAKEDCDDCGGEGWYDASSGGEDVESIPCQTCFPPAKGQIETTWEDLRDDDD